MEQELGGVKPAIERMHVTSSNSKIQKKEPPRVLFSSCIRDAKFKSVYYFSAQLCPSFGHHFEFQIFGGA